MVVKYLILLVMVEINLLLFVIKLLLPEIVKPNILPAVVTLNYYTKTPQDQYCYLKIAQVAPHQL